MCEPLLSVLLGIAKSGISGSVSTFNLGEEQTAFLELSSFAFLPAKREGCNFSASSLTRVIFWLVFVCLLLLKTASLQISRKWYLIVGLMFCP